MNSERTPNPHIEHTTTLTASDFATAVDAINFQLKYAPCLAPEVRTRLKVARAHCWGAWAAFQQPGEGTVNLAVEVEQGPEPAPRLVLCQDCLSVAAYTQARHLGEDLCRCGGDYCGCSDCAFEATEIRAGGDRRETAINRIVQEAGHDPMAVMDRIRAEVRAERPEETLPAWWRRAWQWLNAPGVGA